MNTIQNRKLHALLNQAKMIEDKKTLVKEYTNGRSESSTDMNFHEAEALIRHLEQAVKSTKPAIATVKKTSYDPEFATKNKMRNKMLAIGYSMGWDKSSSPELANLDRAIICRMSVESWCLSDKSKYTKGLYDMTVKELADTVTQMERVARSTLKAIAK